MQIFDNANYNFIKWRWHAIIASALVILAGVGLGVTRGVPMGIDFSGGTLIVLQLDRDGGEELVRNAVASLPGDEVVQQFDVPAKRQVMVRLPQAQTAESGTSVEQGSVQVEQALKAAGVNFTVVSREIVGPVIG